MSEQATETEATPTAVVPDRLDPTTAFLYARFSGYPVMIDPDNLRMVISNLQSLSRHPHFIKMLDSPELSDDDFWPAPNSWQNRYKPYKVKDGVLQIPIRGTLLSRFDYQVGEWATGYTYIHKALERGLQDADVRGIALVSDSPGGEVAGVFELGDKIFEAREQKPVRALVADYAASAAFNLSSAAEQVVVSPSARTGSVGVVMTHIDISGMLADWGIKPTFIFAGKHKVDGNAYQPLPKSVERRFQADVDKLYDRFVAKVARNREMDEDEVRATEALVYDAEDSLEVQFADRVGLLDESLMEFAAEAESTQSEGFRMSGQSEQQDETSVTTAELETARTEARSEGARAERERFAAVVGSEHYAGREEMAKSLFDTDLSSEKIIEVLAAAPKATSDAAPPADGTRNHFAEAMNTEGSPGVGGGETEVDNSPQATADRIFANAGYRPSQTQH